MIQATLKMDIAPQKFDEAMQILRFMIERTKAEAGCISCSVYHDTENEHLVVFEERWRSDADLKRHLSSDDYQKVLLVMEMCINHPEVNFYSVADSGGVEIIKKARPNN
jgi:quinol monooxygenase YgiN